MTVLATEGVTLLKYRLFNCLYVFNIFRTTERRTEANAERK